MIGYQNNNFGMEDEPPNSESIKEKMFLFKQELTSILKKAGDINDGQNTDVLIRTCCDQVERTLSRELRRCLRHTAEAQRMRAVLRKALTEAESPQVNPQLQMPNAVLAEDGHNARAEEMVGGQNAPPEDAAGRASRQNARAEEIAVGQVIIDNIDELSSSFTALTTSCKKSLDESIASFSKEIALKLTKANQDQASEQASLQLRYDQLNAQYDQMKSTNAKTLQERASEQASLQLQYNQLKEQYEQLKSTDAKDILVAQNKLHNDQMLFDSVKGQAEETLRKITEERDLWKQKFDKSKQNIIVSASAEDSLVDDNGSTALAAPSKKRKFGTFSGSPQSNFVRKWQKYVTDLNHIMGRVIPADVPNIYAAFAELCRCFPQDASLSNFNKLETLKIEGWYCLAAVLNTREQPENWDKLDEDDPKCSPCMNGDSKQFPFCIQGKVFDGVVTIRLQSVEDMLDVDE